MTKLIDFRSDTVTLPTKEMREAMAVAELGDDVQGEDPTINKLEKKCAALFGKEAALFLPSGTMGNQIAIMTHTNRGDEIIIEEQSHIFLYEVGGAAALSGVQFKAVKGNNGVMNPEEIRNAIRKKDIHKPRTTLICIENTHNRAGGTVIPIENMKSIREISKEYNIPIHLDGARIFNAAIALGVGVKEISAHVDTIMFCLSKGLCAPVGSMLVGSKEWIDKARRNRKMLGGGMRQAGVLAAAGLIAVEDMVSRLEEDHTNARILAEGLNKIPHFKINMETVQTNMVYIDYRGTGLSEQELISKFADYGIKVDPDYPLIRMVTHYGITKKDIEFTIQSAKEIMMGG
ncbi:MAG TPA: low-specificity L-threonine aldolase [Thermoanaerobacterales bacterium]|nr:low-specificity L-threonine aldolase [Thermoanaerobacterales bacterium]